MWVELAAVEAMLDDIHGSLSSGRDQNTYTLGRIGAHNAVVVVMSEIGTNRAAAVATQLLKDFQSVRFGLLVGIGGGVPDERGTTTFDWATWWSANRLRLLAALCSSIWERPRSMGHFRE
jgi:nucleoside phosphorylase